MNSEFEHHMCSAVDLCHNAPAGSFQSDPQRARVVSILSALRGYLTEHGTTYEQDELLREIKVMEPKYSPPESVQ